MRILLLLIAAAVAAYAQTSITTINSTDPVRNSRADLNANFASLNANKVEGAGSSITDAVMCFTGTGGAAAKFCFDPTVWRPTGYATANTQWGYRVRNAADNAYVTFGHSGTTGAHTSIGNWLSTSAGFISYPSGTQFQVGKVGGTSTEYIAFDGGALWVPRLYLQANTSDPSVSAGTMWYNSTDTLLRYYDGAVRTLVATDETQTLTAKTLTTPIFTGYTVAGLPAAGTAGRLAVVTDAATAGDCDTGGGSALAFCRDSGAAWVALGDGGSGGSGSLAIENNGSAVGTEATLNLIPGTGISQTVVDAGTKINYTPSVDTATILTRAQNQAGTDIYCEPTSASGANYTCSLTPALTAYTEGMVVWFKPDVNNSAGANTVDINSVGSVNIKQADGTTDPGASALVAGRFYALSFDGTAFRMPAAGTGGGASAFTDLSDVPSAYTSQGLKILRVNVGETALEFANAPSVVAGSDSFSDTIDFASTADGACLESTITATGLVAGTPLSTGSSVNIPDGTWLFAEALTDSARIKFCNLSGAAVDLASGTYTVSTGGAAGGSVTSVGLSMPAEFSVTGSPVTTSGTLTVSKANQSANTVNAGPTSGAAAAPTYRNLVEADMPAGVLQLSNTATFTAKTTDDLNQTSAAIWTREIANSATGTSVNLMAKLDGSSQAITTGTGDTAVYALPCMSSCGTSGTGKFAIPGSRPQVLFDGATTVGHYAIMSTSTAGRLASTASPVDGVWVYGVVDQTIGSAGLAYVRLVSPYKFATGAAGGISNVVEDTTPQLGGNLDLNTYTVGDATAADLTKLNALTPTSTELNYVDGVTSAIQTQIDGKAATSHTHAGTDITSGTIKRQFGFMLGADDGDALVDTNDQASIFVNRLGASVTITEVWCESDGGTPTIQLQKDDGTAANILSASLSCSTSGASTTSFVSGENVIANTDRIDFQVATAGGTAKRITLNVVYTVNFADVVD